MKYDDAPMRPLNVPYQVAALSSVMAFGPPSISRLFFALRFPLASSDKDWHSC
jgi:hypothetical protein